MCTGAELGLIGLALSAVGTGTSVYAGQQEKKAMNDVVNEQLRSQRERQKQGSALLAKNVEESTPLNAQKQIDEGATEAQSAYDKLQGMPLAAPDAGLMASNNRAVDTTGDYAKLTSAPAAQLAGLRSHDLNQWIRNLQTNTRLGVNNNLSELNASTLPYMLQGAQQSQSGLQGFGSLLNTAGGLASMYGAQQGGFNNMFSAPQQHRPTPTGARPQYLWEGY